MRKMLRSMILLAIILGPAVPGWSTVVAADPGDFAGGDGSAGNPYQIADWYHLDNVRDHLGDHFILLNDLDSSTDGYAELAGTGADSGDGWQPIGTVGSPFVGSLDGQGCEIGDLVIDRDTENDAGLFGCVGSGGVIEGLGVAGVSVTGNGGVGGLVGDCNGGTVSNCYAIGSVAGASLVGGLVGYMPNGTVSNCYATGSVTGDLYVGGLVGRCEFGTVSNCYATGSVTGNLHFGGLVGLILAGTVSNCYATGSVTRGDVVGGGLVGRINEGTVSNCFWDTQTSGTSDSDGGTGKTTAEMLDMDTFTGWDIVSVASGELNPDSIWNVVDGRSYPFLCRCRVRFELKAGWNMVSVPYRLPLGKDTVIAGFMDKIVAIYIWDPESKSYVIPDTTIEPYGGYWVAVTEDKTIAFLV